MKKVGQSAEDYLETIFHLEQEYGKVRSIDVAKKHGVSRPSINKAVQNLKKLSYVNQESYGDIRLTALGRSKALEIIKRHTLLQFFLTDILKVSPATAADDACKIEHYLSDETMHKLESFLTEYQQEKRT